MMPTAQLPIASSCIMVMSSSGWQLSSVLFEITSKNMNTKNEKMNTTISTMSMMFFCFR